MYQARFLSELYNFADIMSQVKGYHILDLYLYEGKYLGDEDGVFILNTHKIEVLEAVSYFENNKCLLF